MGLDPMVAAALFVVATVSGFVDSIAGGGGLLTIPALLWAGIPPAQALATNKLQACFGSGSASAHFIHAGRVRPRDFPLAIAACAMGAASGAMAVNHLSSAWLENLIPIFLLAAALFFLVSPKLPKSAQNPKISARTYALTIAPLIGFYDGFFGPGTGSFLVLSLVVLHGMELGRATARTKVLNLASNLASFAVFIFGGQIVWTIGLLMALGQALGARLGTKMVLVKGAGIVRPFLILISLALTFRLILTAPHSLWRGLF